MVVETKICIVPPAGLPVSIEQARANMRIDGDYMDQFLELWLRGITAATEHEIGQCFIQQTWEVRLDAFVGEISLPHPVMRVVSVRYLDIAGVGQTLDTAAFRLVASSYQTVLVPASGASWPATAPERHAVVVTVECGYGDKPAAVPINVQLYLLAKLVDQFDPTTRSEKEGAPSPFIDRLLDKCRSYL